jgi:hypothetical protein
VNATRFLELGAIGPPAAAEREHRSQARSLVVGDRRDVVEPAGTLDHFAQPFDAASAAPHHIDARRSGRLRNVALWYGS